MAIVIGVRFKRAGKVYYFDPCGVWPNPGDSVVVETSRGVELGEVITGAREIPDDQLVAALKPIVRVATQDDVARSEASAEREAEAFTICQDRIAQRKLEMKLVDVEYTFDGSKIIFYFTANGRVDFRELVKDLASIFRMRIELRQIGVRDEAKMIGGLGACGRQICCDAFLADFQPVSIKMAKEQNLSLNPTKISGQCGRLMCCLKYEQSYYEATLKRLPRVGKAGMTPDGLGEIVEINPIREIVRVRMRNNDDSYEVREFALEDVSKPVPGPDGEMPKLEMRPPRPKRPLRPEPAPKDGQKAEGEEEKPQRRRFPRSKEPKQLNTDQYFDRLNGERKQLAEKDAAKSAPDDAPADAPKSAPRPEKRRKPAAPGGVKPAPQDKNNTTPAPEAAKPAAPAPEIAKPAAPAPEIAKPAAPAPETAKPVPVPETAKPAAPAPEAPAPSDPA